MSSILHHSPPRRWLPNIAFLCQNTNPLGLAWPQFLCIDKILCKGQTLDYKLKVNQIKGLELFLCSQDKNEWVFFQLFGHEKLASIFSILCRFIISIISIALCSWSLDFALLFLFNVNYIINVWDWLEGVEFAPFLFKFLKIGWFKCKPDMSHPTHQQARC